MMIIVDVIVRRSERDPFLSRLNLSPKDASPRAQFKVAAKEFFRLAARPSPTNVQMGEINSIVRRFSLESEINNQIIFR